MRLLSSKRRMAVIGLAVGLVAGTGGVAIAYFTSSGTGNGSALTGEGANLTINQLSTSNAVAYNSIVNPRVPDTWGLSFGGTNTTEFGTQVTLASATSTLNSVDVTFVSEACQSGSGLTCVTTPGATFTSAPITLTVYDPTTMAVIGSSTKTFQIPYRPSAAGASSSTCGAGTGNNWSNFPNDGSQWYDPTTNNCYYGIKYMAVFPFSSVALSSDSVVYGISYDATSGPTSSLNVALSDEATQVSVGSNTNPGNLFVRVGSGGNADGGSSGQVTCSTVSGANFVSYPTAAGNSNNCGMMAPQNGTFVADTPQVQFNTQSSFPTALVPGGPGQPIDFSITNAGSTPARVGAVTFAVSPSSLPTGCDINWFSTLQSSVAINVTIPGGATVDYQPSGAVLALMESGTNQDKCEGLALNLNFTSN